MTEAESRFPFFDFSPLIDHTLLKAEAGPADLLRLCEEAHTHGFASVCVQPRWVSLAASQLKGSCVRVCTVVGFPLGANTASSKAREAAEVLQLGATEVDMVMALGPAIAGLWDQVAMEFRAVRMATSATKGSVLKVILETCLLTDEDKVRACELAVAEGLDWVKTSTGFSKGGATQSDVALMRQTVGIQAGVKASGGIRTYDEALSMVKAGATRLGLSQSVAVVSGKGNETRSPGY